MIIMADNNTENKVVVHNLTKKFGDLLVLDDISFNVKKNEFLCIVGPTGCGKTTFLNSLSKLYDITSGEILINDEPVNLKKHNIAYIFQEYSNFPWLTIQENIEYGLKVKHVPKDIRREKADYFINMVGLDRFRDYYPRQLSASMLQRAAIARAFAVEPELLLMDEPFASLDFITRGELQSELLRIQDELHRTIVLVTHQLEEALLLAQRIIVMHGDSTVREFDLSALPYPRNLGSRELLMLRDAVTEECRK